MTAQGGTFTHDFSAEHTRRSVQLSAKELRREVLDVVQLHELTGEQCGPALAGAVQELERLKEEGRLRLIGVTGSDPVALLEAVRSDRFDTVMVWKIWNLLDERGDEVLDEAAARGMGVLVGAPFASGILATGPTEGAQLHYGTATAEALDRVRALQAQSDEPLAVRALRFCLDDRVTAVVAAVESLRQLEENVTMMESVTAARGLA
jgi:D-threo-aldose 1-dehydrogenase